eukprot:1073387-Pelagomonas_calceolata.AAC.1
MVIFEDNLFLRFPLSLTGTQPGFSCIVKSSSYLPINVDLLKARIGSKLMFPVALMRLQLMMFKLRAKDKETQWFEDPRALNRVIEREKAVGELAPPDFGFWLVAFRIATLLLGVLPQLKRHWGCRRVAFLDFEVFETLHLWHASKAEEDPGRRRAASLDFQTPFNACFHGRRGTGVARGQHFLF